MGLFLAVVTALVGITHSYVGWRFLTLVPSSPPAKWIVIAILGFMALQMLGAPVLQRLWGPGLVQDAVAWIGYLWMGFFWLLLVATLVGDLGVGLAKSLSWAGLYVPDWQRYWRVGLYALAMIAGIWAVFEALRTPTVRDVEVRIAGLPKSFDGYRIAHLTDTHIGPLLRKSWVEKVVAQVNAQNVDLVVHTGDLVDGSVEQLRPWVEPLTALEGRDGSAYVTGNHESYSGPVEWTREAGRLGFRVLLNQHFVINKGGDQLVIAGVTDEKEGLFLPDRACDPHKALAGVSPDLPIVLLAHQPKSALRAQGLGVDLQLSGHTHGGQIWPFGYLVYLQQPMNVGLRLVGDVQVFTSKGAGFWGPPLRLFASPEIPVIVLRRAE